MAIYRTAMGKKVDMSALLAKNEKTRAVGNAKLNARGDVIDSQGKIVQSVNSRVNKLHSNTVGNRSAQPVKKVAKPGDDPIKRPQKAVQPPQPAPQPVVEELTEHEKELESSFDDDVEVEKIKEKEVKNGPKTTVRRAQS